MTTALEGGEGSASRPGRSLTPGKTRCPLYRRLGGPQGRSGWVRKISSPTGIRSPDRPARSQSLYRLSYRAHTHIYLYKNIFTAFLLRVSVCYAPSSGRATLIFAQNIVCIVYSMTQTIIDNNLVKHVVLIPLKKECSTSKHVRGVW